MRKKTFRIFVNSFVISLFVIWAANRLFVAPQMAESQDISIPEKNIALFFQQDAPMVNYISSTPVESFSLALPTPKPAEKKIMIDEGLFDFDETETDGIKISSIEDVADIPLEESTYKHEEPEAINVLATTASNESLALASASPNSIQTADISEMTSLTDTSSFQTPASSNFNEEAIIPLEFNDNKKSEKIEIATQAPSNQIAMADGGKVDIDDIAIEQKASLPLSEDKEWYQMSEKETDSSPWVVARGTRNPKNNYVLDEDFYKGVSESEISTALGKPQVMEEKGKEVQVAEMVKNILIPIPEDILNDKNLTPQLVSPKKLKKNAVETSDNTANESETEDADKKEGGLLKSLTSIFSSSDETQTNEEDEDSDDETQPSKRRGLFSVFGNNKSSTKILPAEMRLSFQPGRAEISGTTLRWIQAFANKVIEDPSVILEIRIDRTSSFELQQKRLNLLHNILTNKGVDYGRINTVFTSREPNSFIIRTLRIKDNVNNTVQENKKGQTLYYQSW